MKRVPHLSGAVLGWFLVSALFSAPLSAAKSDKDIVSQTAKVGWGAFHYLTGPGKRSTHSLSFFEIGTGEEVESWLLRGERTG